ncbi:MAG: AtpZ/AtpI family protein [Candidatus Komeilibacteria bacterium]|nr:AtpZ/AtpI family protein [Candidatus Komeilibacteria bacterium]
MDDNKDKKTGARSSFFYSADKDGLWQQALPLFVEASGWIVVPIVGAFLLGGWLDSRYERDNFYFLLVTAIAFVTSCAGLVKMGIRALREIEAKEAGKKSTDNTDGEQQH